MKNFCTPACAQKAVAALNKSSKSDIQKVMTLPRNSNMKLPRSSKSEDDLLSCKNVKTCQREGCEENCSTEKNTDYCSSNCSSEVKTEEKVKAAGYRPLVNEGGSSTTSEGVYLYSVLSR